MEYLIIDGDDQDNECWSNEESVEKVCSSSSSYLLMKYTICCAKCISTAASQVFDVLYDFPFYMEFSGFSFELIMQVYGVGYLVPFY